MQPSDPFDRRLESIPHEWKGPLVDMLDTAETVIIKLRSIDYEPDPALVGRLTDLILERHATERW
jgi:hypothetical protein